MGSRSVLALTLVLTGAACSEKTTMREDAFAATIVQTRKYLDNNDGRPIHVTGTLRLVGSEPDTFLVITTVSNFDLLLDFPDDSNFSAIASNQGRRVEADGSVRCVDLAYPNPKYNVRKYHLMLSGLRTIP